MIEELLTVKEVARYLKMGIVTTYKLIQEGKIPAFKIGKQWRVKKEDLLRYIELQKLAPKTTKKSRQMEIMESLQEKVELKGKNQEKGG